MKPDDAVRFIRDGESQRVEFKTTFAEDNEAIESLGAFANADGGTVLFGVKPDGTIVGVDLGANTLENFSNKLGRESQPPLSPTIYSLHIDRKVVVSASVVKREPGQLFHVFNKALVRVGRTNQVMAPEAQRARLLQERERWADERDRPRFEVTRPGAGTLETQFAPEFKVRQFSGDAIANSEWRMRGPRFSMDWRQAVASMLERTKFVHKFDLTAPTDGDDQVETDEMGFEIRFYWHGEGRSELHRWPIMRRELPKKVLWDIGEEILPPIELDNPAAQASVDTHEHDHFDYCEGCGMVRCDRCGGWYKPEGGKCSICGFPRSEE